MDDFSNNVDVKGRILQLMKAFENQSNIGSQQCCSKGIAVQPHASPRTRETVVHNENLQLTDIDDESSSNSGYLAPDHSNTKILISPTIKKEINEFYENFTVPIKPAAACIRRTPPHPNQQSSDDSPSSITRPKPALKKKKMGSRRSILMQTSLSLLSPDNDIYMNAETPSSSRHSTGTILELKSPIETCFPDSSIEKCSGDGLSYVSIQRVVDESSSLGDSDDSWFDFSDDDDDTIYSNVISRISERISITQVDNQPTVSKWQRIVQEFVSTETSYVQKLKLISEDFLSELLEMNAKEPMIPENVPLQIFSNIETIYRFHKEHLLPQLEECAIISTNGQPPRYIGSVFKKLAPFLKMYTVYVRNFDNARKIFARWRHKSAKFLMFIREFETRLKCGQLEIQSHMLEPIQRVPRYKLLLQEYLKCIPEDSADSHDAKEALELITTAASHINEERKLAETTAKLLKIQDMLLDRVVDVVGPGRELVKEGKVSVSSIKTKDDEERYLFLFNDMLLVCRTIVHGLKPKYKVAVKFLLPQMKIKDSPTMPMMVMISATEGIVELKFDTIQEKEDWSVALNQVLQKWKSDRILHRVSHKITDEQVQKRLGQHAPIFVNFQDTSVCMSCSEEFGMLIRRHHCHCCGSVICGKCCCYKAVMEYNTLEKKICRLCFNKLQIEQSRYGTNRNVSIEHHLAE